MPGWDAVMAALVGAAAVAAVAGARTTAEERAKRRNEVRPHWYKMVGRWIAEGERMRRGMSPEMPTKLHDLTVVLHDRASEAIAASYELSQWEQLFIKKVLPEIVGKHIYDFAVRVPTESLPQDDPMGPYHVLAALMDGADKQPDGQLTVRFGSMGYAMWAEDQFQRGENDVSHSTRTEAAGRLIASLAKLQFPRRRYLLSVYAPRNWRYLRRRRLGKLLKSGARLRW